MYTDEDTSSFVREQKREQYRDLKHALGVMGRIDSSPGSTSMRSCSSTSGSGAQRRRTLALLSTKFSDAPVSPKCSLLPEHMVLIYLLENNRLLLSSVNQMKLEAQVSIKKKQTADCPLPLPCHDKNCLLLIGELELDC